MKLPILALALVLAFGTALTQAQTSTVPTLLSYQGRVTDSGGNLIGNSTPVNRTVQFKLYNAASGGTALWAESQTVTISAGEFSVLIGNGTGISGLPGPSTPGSPIKTLTDTINSLTAEGVYLGVAVSDGTAAAPVEISPRQRLVTAAYAARARVAETVASSAVIESMLNDASVTLNKISTGAVNSAKIADESIASADILNGSITGSDIATGTITPDKISGAIGLWATNSSGIHYNGGKVGIGQSSPGYPLSFADTFGDKISFYGQGATSHGIGIQAAQLQIHTDAVAADILFGYGSSASFSETMRIKGTGNVGIGTNSPGTKLDVRGAISAAGASGYVFNSGDTDGGLFSPADGMLTLNTNGVERLRVNGSGNVGIGTNSPAEKLTISNGWLYFSNLEVGIKGSGGSDSWQIYGAGSNDDMKLIIQTSDNGDEPIQFYQNSTYRGGISADGAFETGEGMSIRLNGSYNGDQNDAYIGCNNGQFLIRTYNTTQNRSTWRNALYDGDSNWDFSSDVRLKKDIVDAEPMLDRLLQVRFRRFHWKEDEAVTPLSFGVVAQELEPIFPQLVNDRLLPGETETSKTVAYTEFATIAAKSIQELKVRNDVSFEELKSEHSAQQAALEKKDAEIRALQARVAELEAKDKTHETRLAAIEKALLSVGSSGVKPVSLKKGEGEAE